MWRKPRALAEIGWPALEIAGLDERIAEIEACFPEDEPGDWTIDHVAVLPEFRGHGLARRVVERAVERGRSAGFGRAKLDVYQGNEAARRAYEKIGFRIQKSFGGEVMRRVLGRDALDRMILRLG